MRGTTQDAPWARLQVVRGERPRVVSFQADTPARVVVGSDAAELCLRAPDVAPRQLDVVWDGQNLWLEDALRLGRTFVNGQLLNEWTCIVGQAVVSFGIVRLWVLAKGEAPRQSSPNFSALETARVFVSQPSEQRRRNTERFTWPEELREYKREGAA
jgi:hypothetical protein